MARTDRTSCLLVGPYFEYKNFIQECYLKNYPDEVLLQYHHIIPKSLGGSDAKENIVKLSIDDHKVAHEMLSKCFDPDTYEVWVNTAAVMLLNRGIKTAEELELHRNLFMGENNPFYGKTHSDEVKSKMSEITKQRLTGLTYEERYGSQSEIEKQKRKEGVLKYYSKMTASERKLRSERISKSRIGCTPWNCIKVTINGVTYKSIKEASKSSGISEYLIRKELKNEKINGL